jgi:hypothetical protein
MCAITLRMYKEIMAQGEDCMYVLRFNKNLRKKKFLNVTIY